MTKRELHLDLLWYRRQMKQILEGNQLQDYPTYYAYHEEAMKVVKKMRELGITKTDYAKAVDPYMNMAVKVMKLLEGKFGY